MAELARSLARQRARWRDQIAFIANGDEKSRDQKPTGQPNEWLAGAKLNWNAAA
jgi:hypothetical protein